MRAFVVICLLVIAACRVQAEEMCTTIHGRAHYYGGDGQLRIWQIGTHHDYTPDDSSRGAVIGWLEAGVTKFERGHLAGPDSAIYLFADFEICPIEPFRKGFVQRARVKSASNRHYVHAR